MKKFFVLLLIVTLAAFVFTGCTPPAEGEGEGEGEGEVEGITIVVEGAYQKGGYTYVQGDKTYDVTVTFPAPENNVIAFFSCEYGLDGVYGFMGKPNFLLPNADKTVWTGKITIGECCNGDDCDVCSLWVEWGMCTDCYTGIPVIVDCVDPYATFEVSVKNCVCEGCEVTFKSLTEEFACDPDELCCGDDCAGLAGWAINIFDRKPFDNCCNISCAEPKFTCSGTDCPIECTVSCLDADTYYVVIDLEDNVGNTTRYCYVLTVEGGLYDGESSACTITIDTYAPVKDTCECTSPMCFSCAVDGKWYIGDLDCCSRW